MTNEQRRLHLIGLNNELNELVEAFLNHNLTEHQFNVGFDYLSSLIEYNLRRTS